MGKPRGNAAVRRLEAGLCAVLLLWLALSAPPGAAGYRRGAPRAELRYAVFGAGQAAPLQREDRLGALRIRCGPVRVAPDDAYLVYFTLFNSGATPADGGALRFFCAAGGRTRAVQAVFFGGRLVPRGGRVSGCVRIPAGAGGTVALSVELDA